MSQAEQNRIINMKLGRNDRCPCGSGRKYKKCCYLDQVKNAEITRALSMAATIEEVMEILSKPMEVYRLKIVLIRIRFDEIEEEVSRTFEVAGDHTLYQLHLNIQHAFNWDNDHLFSFYFGGKLFDRENEYAGSPLGDAEMSNRAASGKSTEKTQIRDLGLVENARFLYLFDYGDELVHEVIVEKIRNINDRDSKLPAFVSQVGTAPPQYGEHE